jgi:midasin (ATPase involved in ribosome maturation)
VIEDAQIWILVGVTSGVVALIVVIGIIVNAYIVSSRLARVLSDVEEMIHADLKSLEDRVDAAIARARAAETRITRE